jgi:hypothetical protein
VNNLTEIYSNPELQAGLVCNTGVSVGGLLLKLNRALQCIYHTRKLSQHSVASFVDLFTVKAQNFLLQKVRSRIKLRMGRFFIAASQTAVSGYVCVQDDCELSFH